MTWDHCNLDNVKAFFFMKCHNNCCLHIFFYDQLLSTHDNIGTTTNQTCYKKWKVRTNTGGYTHPHHTQHYDSSDQFMFAFKEENYFFFNVILSCPKPKFKQA